jgi:hypothetical protein
MGLRNERIGGKDQCRLSKGQEGLTETETSPGIAAARPGQCICRFPIGMGGYAKFVLGRAPVYWRGTEGLITIGPTVL